jgi:hypothetical protein
MGILDKIPFLKKKDDDLDFGKDLDLGDLGMDTGSPKGVGGEDMSIPGLDDSSGENNSLDIPDMSNYKEGVDMSDNQGMPSMSQAQTQSPSNNLKPSGLDSFSQDTQQKGHDFFNQPQQQKSQQQPQQQMQQQFQQSPSSNHQYEILSAKLDAIKANLESINQRIANIERIASSPEPEIRRNTW